ncbi:MAG: hypothetical protein JWM57_3024 [Phycisphaerales bacterium]|nr:hypothetical protein [Phycisphaerales bacterium]
MTFRRFIATAAAAVTLSLPAGLHAADAPNDSFIAGYAAAVLERELSVKTDGLNVKYGYITFNSGSLSATDKAQALKVLSSVPGVKGVRLNDSPAVQPQNAIENIGPSVAQRSASTTAPAAEDDKSPLTTIQTDPSPLVLFLGAGRTFDPLLADPKWPHFFASYSKYDQDSGSTHLNTAAYVGYGETIAFLKKSYSSGFRWEIGVQAGLFAIFDLDSASKDLIDADYMIGPYYAARQGDFSLLARLYHQSTHLGDEYILRSTADVRQNFSFETANLILSYDLPEGFRVYGGGGYAFDVAPTDVRPWNVEYGVEWISPTTVFGTNWIRPVAAVDFQNRETTNWDFTYSVHAGVQLEDPTRFTQRLQLMFEYYDGNSPNGQFYDNHVRYYGIGAHFYF